MSSHATLVRSVGTATAARLVVALLTPPTETATLRRFFTIARPGGRGWASIMGTETTAPDGSGFGITLLSWVFGCTFAYSARFGIGAILDDQLLQGKLCLSAAAAAAVGLCIVLPKLWRTGPVEAS